MRHLVFDFETTGLNKDSANRYIPYPTDKIPLPRENYPTELALAIINSDGNVERETTFLIRGAERMSPWVEEHCPHLSVAACERDGVDFMEALQTMADMVGSGACTLVAHNIQYDWDDVIVKTVRERGEVNHDAFQTLNRLPRWCTCINPITKGDRSAYYWSKIGKWIGPKLSDLCRTHSVEYNATEAHAALYDVRVTAKCLWYQRGYGNATG